MTDHQLSTPTRKQRDALARVALDYLEFEFEFADGGILISDDSGQQAFACLRPESPNGISATATAGNRSQEAITRACSAVYHRAPQFAA